MAGRNFTARRGEIRYIFKSSQQVKESSQYKYVSILFLDLHDKFTKLCPWHFLILNVASEIFRSLSYVDGTMATKPQHPNRVYNGFSASLLSLSCCVEAPSFLLPHLIILSMAWTALQNKQSFENWARIVGQMLNWCWLSLLGIFWPKSAKSLVYHNIHNIPTNDRGLLS